MQFSSPIRLILYVIVLLVTLPALGTIVYTGAQSRERAITATGERSAAVMNNLATRCRVRAESTRSLLRFLSGHEALRGGDPLVASTLFAELLQSRDDITNICLLDARGAIVASALPWQDAHLNEALATPGHISSQDPFFGGDFSLEPVGGKPALSFSLYVSELWEKDFGAYLVAWVKPESVLHMEQRLLGWFKGVLYIRDSMGKLVYVYPKERQTSSGEYERAVWERVQRLSRTQGDFFIHDDAGREYIVTYERVNVSGMAGPAITLELSVPKSEAYADADAASMRNVALLVLAFFAALAMAYSVGDKILVRPIRDLVDITGRIAGGEPHAKASATIRQGEMGQLAVTFDEMAAALESRNRQLVDAKNAADDASRAKGDFLANMSHEIRTPMNGVIGMAYLALKSGLSSTQHEHVSKIFTAANALLRIINDILDFSKIESGKLDMEHAPFNLKETLDSISSIVSPKAEEKGIEVLFGVDSNVPMSLVGDSLRLGQILINLLNNAVKFTHKGEIIVSCTLSAKGGDQADVDRNLVDGAETRQAQAAPSSSVPEGQSVWLRFMVKDTGIGMSQEQQSAIFSAFTQADGSITRRFGGTGLGLVITKRLIEMMGGDISLLSEHGKGTTAIFTACFSLPEGDGTEKGETYGNGTRVLVVDANGPAGHMMQSMLNSMDFRADLASSASESFAMLWQGDVDDAYQVVLMDWRMPGMDGVEATWRLRNELNLNNVPAVFITSTQRCSEVLQQAEKAGAEGVIFKPVDKQTLSKSLLGAPTGDTFSSMSYSPVFMEQQGQESFPGARVLVVEDNPINQEVAAELLESAGIEVTTVDNGLEALKAVEESGNSPPFDLVLLDLRMPEMDGYEAARRLRADPRNDTMPIVAMTAHVLAADRQRCLEVGMNDHISKPIEVDKFFSTLSRWIPLYGEEDSLVTNEERFEESGQDGAIKSRRPSVKENAIFLPGLDTDIALGRLGNNERLYVKLLKQFLAHYDNTESQFYSSLETGGLVDAQRVAHTLKGLAGSIGASALAVQCAKLESSFAEGGNLDAIRVLAKNCFDDLAKIQALLREAFAAQEAEADNAASASSALNLTAEQKQRKLALLKALLSYLQEDDAEAATYFSNNSKELATLLPAEYFSRLRGFVARFQFEEAIEWIHSHENVPEHDV